MASLDTFTVGTARLCQFLGLPVPTFNTLMQRDGLLFLRPAAKPKRPGPGIENHFTFDHALKAALALKLKAADIPSADACMIGSTADVMTPFLADEPVRFGFAGGRIANVCDHHHPSLSVPSSAEGERLLIQFIHEIIAAEGGQEADAALTEIDARICAARA